MLLTSFAASMTVNILVTALIVLKILKLFLEVNPDTPLSPVERTLGSLMSSIEALTPKPRCIIFALIESSMALFAIQLVRVVLYNLPVHSMPAINLIIAINQMFNVIIRSIHFL